MSFCTQCGAQTEGQLCPACTAASQPQPQTVPSNIPSLLDLRCPKCSGQNFRATGKKGALGKSIAMGAAFGAIGNLVASSNAQTDYATEPMQYRCNDCKEKFVSLPMLARPEEFLPAPCTIQFQRMSNFVGMAVVNTVYLNGVNMGSVKNGKTITFLTPLRYNTIYVTDMHGVAFKPIHRFEAQPGGTVQLHFKRNRIY